MQLTESDIAGLTLRPPVWIGFIERLRTVTQEDESRNECRLISEIAMNPFTQDAPIINVTRCLSESRSRKSRTAVLNIEPVLIRAHMIDALDGRAIALFNECGAEVKRLKEELRDKRTGFNAGEFRAEEGSGIDILKSRESPQIVDRGAGQ